MEYTNSITINLPVSRVIELFDNEENLKKWQEGLVGIDHISGSQGEPGAKSKLRFEMGKRKVDLIETVVVKDLPREVTFIYETKGVYNVSKNFFKEEGGSSTRYVTENEFKFKGLYKLLGILMPGAFRKQTQKYLVRFKEFAENVPN